MTTHKLCARHVHQLFGTWIYYEMTSLLTCLCSTAEVISASDSWREWKGRVCAYAFWSSQTAPSLLVPAISVHHMCSCLGWWGCCFALLNGEHTLFQLGSVCQTGRKFKFPYGWTGLLLNKCQDKMLERNGNKTIKKCFHLPLPQTSEELDFASIRPKLDLNAWESHQQRASNLGELER